MKKKVERCGIPNRNPRVPNREGSQSATRLEGISERSKIARRDGPSGESPSSGSSAPVPGALAPEGPSERTIPVGTTFDEFRRLLELERDRRDLTKALDKLLADVIADLGRQAKRSTRWRS
jgi:hypothetical protein